MNLKKLLTDKLNHFMIYRKTSRHTSFRIFSRFMLILLRFTDLTPSLGILNCIKDTYLVSFYKWNFFAKMIKKLNFLSSESTFLVNQNINSICLNVHANLFLRHTNFSVSSESTHSSQLIFSVLFVTGLLAFRGFSNSMSHMQGK